MLINKIKSKFADANYLRPNLYNVYFTTPFSQNYGDDMTVLCKDATLPFLTFNTKQYHINNTKHNIIQDIDYDPASFAFYLDDNNIITSFMMDWINRQRVLTQDNYKNAGVVGLGYKSDYEGTIQVEMLDIKGNTRVYGFLMNAFPVNIDNIALSYDQNNTISTMSVNFMFDEVIYMVANSTLVEESEYKTHMVDRQEPYIDNSLFGKYFSSVGYPLEVMRDKVGGIIGQENLYKLENRLNIKTNDSITSGNNLTRKAEKNFSLAEKNFSLAKNIF